MQFNHENISFQRFKKIGIPVSTLHDTLKSRHLEPMFASRRSSTRPCKGCHQRLRKPAVLHLGELSKIADRFRWILQVVITAENRLQSSSAPGVFPDAAAVECIASVGGERRTESALFLPLSCYTY